ncbi:MAG TPA: VCBS repeat-containing protein, partial [Bryobacteraceae bacterium]|nr:VCBS repeat-containing protein [Bryobacteraceae bacterium]
MKTLLATLGALLLAACLAHRAFPQMMGSGRAALPRKPLPPGLKAPQVRFEDLAAKAGLTGVNVSGSDKQQMYIVENTGNGVAAFDYDNDGLVDLFFVNADRFDRTGAAPTHFLYHNLGGLRFEDVTAKSGITHNDWGQGVCAGDVDNDGRVDLFVTAWGRNVLWRNQGDGTFRDETQARGLAAPKRWSTGCAFLDYDRDGNLDLFVAHYLDFDPAKVPKPGDRGQCVWKGFAVVCGPMGLPPETMSLYHHDGGGRFTEVTERAGIK